MATDQRNQLPPVNEMTVYDVQIAVSINGWSACTVDVSLPGNNYRSVANLSSDNMAEAMALYVNTKQEELRESGQLTDQKPPSGIIGA